MATSTLILEIIFQGIVDFVAVEDQAAMGEYGVQGFPTLKWIVPGSSPVEYSAGRTAKGRVFPEEEQRTRRTLQETHDGNEKMSGVMSWWSCYCSSSL